MSTVTSKNILKESISMKNKLKILSISYFCHSSIVTPEELFTEISSHRTSWLIGKVSASNLLTLDLPESTHTLSDNIPMKLSLSGTEHLRFYLEWKSIIQLLIHGQLVVFCSNLHTKSAFSAEIHKSIKSSKYSESLEPQQSHNGLTSSTSKTTR